MFGLLGGIGGRLLKHFPKTYCFSLIKMSGEIQTFVFLDLETTGLPSEENNKTKITELTLLTVESKHLILGVIPRAQNKLTMCFNPRKLISCDSERITGLNNELLEHFAPFTNETVQLINQFLKHCKRPICFVAHNGNRFDYPILRTEIEKTSQELLEGDVLCIDSLQAFKQLTFQVENERTEVDKPDFVPLEFQDGFNELLCQVVDEYEKGESVNKGENSESVDKGLKRALEVQKINETTPKKEGNLNKQVNKKVKSVPSQNRLNFGTSFKLADVYERLTKKEAIDAHQAENDVYMLAMSAAVLGHKFTNWSNKYAKKFNDIPKMTYGRKIGT